MSGPGLSGPGPSGRRALAGALLPLLLAVGARAAPPPAQDWRQLLAGPAFQGAGLRPSNERAKYLHFDFSKLLLPKNEFLGYVGGDFQRLRITFSSVIRRSPDAYEITGRSNVKGQLDDFKGTLRIREVRVYRTPHLGADDEQKDAGIRAEGVVIAGYELKENPKQKFSGTFRGTMLLGWYVDRAGILKYDDIEDFSDNYANNQYVGTWTPYGGKAGKPANWGEYRIPFSGDLDIGAGEFGADPRYKDRGW